MTRVASGCVTMALCAMACAPAAAAGEPARKRIEIPRVEAAPKLDDYASGKGPGVAVSEFLQREPGDLVPVSEPTTAFLSYDRDNLYVAFVCKSSNPSSIRARMSRRESIFDDDFVAVHLDPFQERQRAYMFFSNPIGIQADGVDSEGSGDDLSYDAVWRSNGRLTSDGYLVLMAIPFKSLRFPSGTDPSAWGIALERTIPTRSESSFWPGITRRISGFSAQFGELDGIRGASPGRNIQFIPYGTFAGARVLDEATGVRSHQTDFRGGLDAKVVVKDKISVDATLNPDFSQVESDEPQVTINQRFEVFFPEKRPFFLENADYFQTPITLFFSRRIRDPQVGARVTGRAGRWAIGALTMDDRQPGRQVDPTSDAFGDRTVDTVVRARRDFSNQSRLGFVLTNRKLGASSNTVASMDTRVRLNPRWFAEGQALFTQDTALDKTSTTGGGLWLALHRSGRTFTDDVFYQDLSAGVHTPLGFVPRTDIRQAQQFATFRWHPKSGPVTAHGPNMFLQGTWDHAGTPQDWIVRFPYSVQLGQTFIFARHAQIMERFNGVDYREHEQVINAASSVISWMSVSGAYSTGTRPNFFPAPGVAPSLADFIDASAGLTFRPLSRLLLDETYLYSRLSQPSASIFDNHIVRSKVHYQFTRALSLRGIVDYNAVLPNETLVGLERRKHLTADVLLTYLVHPGTAVYIGYTDGYDNLRKDPTRMDGGLSLGGAPTTSTGRQVFVKSSWLFRF
ncbi:MAG TPA: DUF5916 domain-containing protein [Vicinamibacterales bacterium]